MTIDFALSLSHEGIEMLQRVQGGWRRLGRADVSSLTLTSDLTGLKNKADELCADVPYCKLIIPADQIKYVVIDSADPTQDEIEAVMKDATPYALDALVIDFERTGGKTQIAAVARETLQEAESFAVAHGFSPVAFVAIPPTDSFRSEVFFGPTSAAPEILGQVANVTRDSTPVQLAGTRLKARATLNAVPDQQSIRHTLNDIAIDAIPAEVWQRRPVQTAAPKTVPVATKIDAAKAAPLPPAASAQPGTNNRRYIAVAAGVAVLAAALGWAQLSRDEAVDQPVFAGQDTQIPAIAPDIALQEAPQLGSLAPAEAAPFESATLAEDPVLALLQDVTNLAAPEATLTAPSTPQIGPRMFTVATPLFGEFAPVAQNLPTGAITQEPSPVVSTPILVQSTVPEAAIAAPQAPPPAPIEPAERTVAAPGVVLSPAEAVASYDATGVWQRSPRLIDTPSGTIPLGFRPPSPLTAPLRVAPPVFAMRPAELPVPFAAPRNPPAAGVVFARDENGFIAATPAGTLTPDGAFVIAGLPDLPVRPRPELSQDALDRLALLAPAAPTDGVIVIAGAPDVVPPLRPGDFAVPQAQAEATVPLGGVGIAGLELQPDGTIGLDPATVEARNETDLRPQLRPTEVATAAATEPSDITDILREIAASDATLRFDNSTALAVRASLRPNTRPSGFAQRVAAAQDTQPSTNAGPIVAAAPVPPQDFAPVPGGVARAATQEDVINLRDINLIGVYGRPNARRALVRLSNGRYVRVEVGSALDGGQVTAIGDEALNYVKRGRTYAVGMPSQ